MKFTEEKKNDSLQKGKKKTIDKHREILNEMEFCSRFCQAKKKFRKSTAINSALVFCSMCIVSICDIFFCYSSARRDGINVISPEMWLNLFREPKEDIEREGKKNSVAWERSTLFLTGDNLLWQSVNKFPFSSGRWTCSAWFLCATNPVDFFFSVWSQKKKISI